MASPVMVKVACLVVTCMVLGIPLADANLSCSQVQANVAPCIDYLKSPGETVPGPCCDGVKTINDEAKTTADRQATCRCLKTTMSLPGLKLTALAALPAKCKVNFPYKLKSSTDCDKIE